MKLGIICGHDLEEFTNNSEELTIETIYGNVNVFCKIIDDIEIFFINRHGKNKNIPPHKINYLANIQAMESCNIKNIISIFTVGSLKKNILIGDLVIPDDFIDFTKSRNSTFFENNRIHTDMNNPFCNYLRKLLIESCDIEKNNVHENGIYLTTEGPRLETPAEIKLFSNFTDIVGMTLVPEIVLAREKNICYAAICLVCNMAAGLQAELKTDEISKIFIEKKSLLSKIINKSIINIENKKKCKCYEKND